MNNLGLRNIMNGSWNAMKKNYGYLLLILIVSTLAFAWWLPCTIDFPRWMALVQQQQTGHQPTPSELLSIFVPNALTIAIIGLVSGCILNTIGAIAIYRIADDCVVGRRIDFNEQLGNALRKFLGYLGVSLLVTAIFVSVKLAEYVLKFVLGTVLGELCYLALLIFLSVRLLFACYIKATQDGVGILDSIARSWRITKGHFWMLLAIGVSVGLICLLGMMMCCIGLIFTIPFTWNMLAVTYHALANESEQEDAQVEETPQSPQEAHTERTAETEEEYHQRYMPKQPKETDYNQKAEGDYQK